MVQGREVQCGESCGTVSDAAWRRIWGCRACGTGRGWGAGAMRHAEGLWGAGCKAGGGRTERGTVLGVGLGASGHGTGRGLRDVGVPPSCLQRDGGCGAEGCSTEDTLVLFSCPIPTPPPLHPRAVLQRLLQQRARPPADPLAAGGGFPPALRPAASRHREVRGLQELGLEEGERQGRRGGAPLSSPSTSWRRDLAELSQEVSRAGRAAHAACVQLGAHLRLAEGRAGAAREQQAQQLAQLEEQLAARARDAELEKSALGDRWGSRGGGTRRA